MSEHKFRCDVLFLLWLIFAMIVTHGTGGTLATVAFWAAIVMAARYAIMSWRG